MNALTAIPNFPSFGWVESKTPADDLVPVVQKVDSGIRWINLYLVDNAIGFPNTYPPGSDLSGG